MSMRKAIIEDCVNKLRDFGYVDVDVKNIFTDTLYKRFFKSILEQNLGKDSFIDCAIQDLLKDIEESDIMKNKITWEDLERKDIAIHTPSKELMVKVANVIADKYGDITYEQNIINSRENGDVCPDAYYVYEKDTYVDLTHNKWHFADKECFLCDNYELVEYEEVKHLFEDYIDTIETEEVKYLAEVKLINGKKGYFREEFAEGHRWLFATKEIKYADIYDDLTSLKKMLNLYKEEIEEYKIIKQITTTTIIKTFEFIK